MPLRLVTFQKQDANNQRIGALTEDGVLDLTDHAEQEPASLPAAWDNSLITVLSQIEWIDWAKQCVQTANEQHMLERASVRLLPPVPRPGKLFLLAGNYMEHLREAASFDFQKEDEGLPEEEPHVFVKPPVDTLIGDGEPIILSRNHRFVDYEAEMAVIIGKTGRYIPAEQALDYVAGITAFNDVSEREWGRDRQQMTEREKFFAWLNGKWFDSFAPMGPCAVPMADVPDIHNLDLQLRVNGQLRQHSSTALMMFDVPQIIAYISGICTLRAGDVIATGTPEGVGHAQGSKLEDQDIIQVELELVGTLTNPVQAEAQDHRSSQEMQRE